MSLNYACIVLLFRTSIALTFATLFLSWQDRRICKTSKVRERESERELGEGVRKKEKEKKQRERRGEREKEKHYNLFGSIIQSRMLSSVAVCVVIGFMLLK